MASASQDLDLDATPKALEDELGLIDGTRYLIANTGEGIIKMRAAAAQPGADSRGHFLPPYETIIVEPAAGLKSWFWSLDPDGGQIISTETA